MEQISMDELRAALARILGELPSVAAAYAFGSRASGKPTERSDLDLALVLRGDPSRDDPLLAERVSGRLATGLGTPIEIDTHVAADLPLRVRGRIVTSGVLLYEADPSSRVEFETATRRLYFDFLPFIDRDAREALRSSSASGPGP